tara:strand:- start:8429 stop:12142 length:3714 start_codon:yes stop_codon:yes gene_type:complete
MAKKRTVHVDVIVDDKGTTKKLAIDSDRLAKGLEKGSKGTKDFDRNLRGVIQTSAAGGRNFAALAQGIAGGIVPVYAAFAAQVFAIGAAFRFLQSAGDLATLEKGQIAYASSTGIALKTLTTRIQEATENQIAFQDAAQAAAIGTAAGLTADQLERLGKAAKDASIILGRDVTDSFNRLVRGVTKAEPELLDELGIILRLKDATETYAASLGKSANDLSQFEKSQAVANDVLTQAEEKYGRIIAIVDPSVNVFNKFGKAFDDIVNSIKRGLDKISPLFEKLAENPFSSLLLAAPLLQGFLKIMVPGFDELGKKAVSAFDGIGEGLENMKRNADTDLKSLQLLTGDAKAAESFIDITNQELIELADNSETGFLGLKKLQGGGELAGRTITKNLNDAKNATGVFASMPDKVRLKYVKMFGDLQIASKVTNGVMKAEFAKGTAFIRLQFAKAGAFVKQQFTSMLAASGRAVRGIIKNFGKIASAIGILSIGFDFMPDKVKRFFSTLGDPELEKFLDKLKSTNIEFSKLQQIQTILNEDFEATGQTIIGVLKNVADASAGISGEDYSQNLRKVFQAISDSRLKNFDKFELLDINKLIGEQVKSFKNLRDVIETTNLSKSSESAAAYQKELDKILELLERARKGDDVTVNLDEFLKAKAAFEDIGKTIASTIQRTKDIGQALNDVFTDMVTKGPQADLLANLNAQVKAYEKIKKDGTGAQGANLVLAEKQVKMHTELLRVLEAQRKVLIDSQKAEIARDQLSRRSLVFATRRGKTIVNSAIQEQELLTKKTEVEKEIDTIKGLHVAKNSTLNDDQKTQLELLFRQHAALEDQILLIEEQRSALFEIQDAIKQGLETGLETNIYDLLVGNEDDLKDAALKLAQTVEDTLAKRLSGMFTDFIMQSFNIQTTEQKQKDLYDEIFTDGAGKIKKAVEDALKDITTDQQAMHKTRKAGTGLGIAETQQPDGSFTVEGGPGTKTEAILQTLKDIDSFNKRIEAKGQNAANVFIKNVDEFITKFGNFIIGAQAGAGTDATNNVAKLVGSSDEGKDLDEFFNRPSAHDMLLEKQSKISADASDNVEKETENILKNEKNVTTFGGFVGDFKSAMNIVALALNPLGGVIQSGVTGFLESLFTGAEEGRHGGVMKNYSTGGIARGSSSGFPAILHGTEAVVPLPNGRSIPVQMQGAAGVNNISVSVNMGEGSTNIEGGQGEVEALGKLVAGAVQDELQKQQRPGGILSPFGAA